MQQFKYFISVSFFVVLTACGGGGSSGSSSGEETTVPVANGIEDAQAQTGGDTGLAIQPLAAQFYVTPDGVEECSNEDIKRRVEFDMRDYYIYYRDVPQLDQADFESPEDYIRALRVEPDIYSGVADAVEQTTLLNAGEREGYGFQLSESNDGKTRFRRVFLGSSVDRAGVKRGDEIIEINGIPYDDISNDEFNEIFAREDGNVAEILVRTGDEEARLVDFVYGVYRWQTAGPARLFVTDANPTGVPTIGYMPVSAFLGTTLDEMASGFEWMTANGQVEELILDLRYNGGGVVRVANFLASVIGGNDLENQVLSLFRHNDKFPENNYFDFFERVNTPLNLSRVIVLTTERSASASELIINSLAPYMTVVVVGEKTEGKAFGSSARFYCGKAINAMNVIGENADGNTVLGGLEPTCPVEDEWMVQASDRSDPLLSAGLSYAQGRECGALVAANNEQSLFRAASRPAAESRGDEPLTPFSEH